MPGIASRLYRRLIDAISKAIEDISRPHRANAMNAAASAN